MKIGDPMPCPTCAGDGEVFHAEEYDGSHFRECEECDGTGVQLDRWHRRAYLAISQEAGAVGWPKHYREDLTVHDRAYCAEHDASEPFAWILRECGTHVVRAQPEAIDGAGNMGWSHVRACFSDGDRYRFYKWDGHVLREVATVEDLATWLQSIGQAIAYKRKRAA